MVSVAAIGGSAIAKVPGVSGRGIYVHQSAVGKEVCRAVLAACATEEIGQWGSFHMHRVLYAIMATIQVVDDQLDDEIACGSVQMARVWLGAGVQCTSGWVAKIPGPGGYLAAQVLVGVVGEKGVLVFAVADVIKTGDGAVGNRYGGLVKGRAPTVVPHGEGNGIGAARSVGMVDVRGIGEIGGVIGGAIAKSPDPLFEVALPRRVAAQVGEMGDTLQAIGRVVAEKGVGVGKDFYRMGYRIMAAVGIGNAERYGIGAVCWIDVARAVWCAIGGVGAIAKIPVPGAGHLQVIP